ncbi:MAG: hypothetical protein XD93_0214 [candidate division WS6 bacterium 34_10]|jgi:uncharacterized membrane protein|uniref:Chloroplast import component protein (Tic20) n=1 Tax=candidate division WS6 bacterium 34_10 TaxID=1641389 RepID=A0A117M0H1_9BACT|nr:MAG: hypothetical protein XD93_0214 [candidate division WS6 bacterium 34_10]
MAEEATQKSGKKVYTFQDIQFNEANKTMAILACIPIVGLILLFTEKDDKFVRYMGAQFTIGALVSIALSVLLAIPLLNIIIAIVAWIYNMALFVMMIIAMVQASKGERFDIPVISKYALQLMAKV